jgi:hypothetical protein
VLHVSDGKRVQQALVDPKSIVPYYVVWDRNASPGRDFSSGRLNMLPDTCRKIITTCVILHNLIRLRYPATHNNLMDLEDQNQNEFCIYQPASSSLCLSLPWMAC